MNLITIGYIVVLFAALYFLIIRPQQKRSKDQQNLVSSLKAGDRIVTAGGLFGTIERVEDDVMELRIADGVVVDVAVSAVVRKVDSGGAPVESVAPDETPEPLEHRDSDEVEEPPVRVTDDDGPQAGTASSPLGKKDE